MTAPPTAIGDILSRTSTINDNMAESGGVGAEIVRTTRSYYVCHVRVCGFASKRARPWRTHCTNNWRLPTELGYTDAVGNGVKAGSSPDGDSIIIF